MSEEVNFTPGPWLVQGIRGNIFVGGQTGTIAKVGSWSSTTLQEDVANARLIATAPELLSVLREIESRMEIWRSCGIQAGHTGRDSDWTELLADVRAAISKATGN